MVSFDAKRRYAGDAARTLVCLIGKGQFYLSFIANR